MTVSVLKEDQNTKSFKHLFNLTQTHSMQIFREIFVKPQNDTETTDKQLNMMKKERLEDCWHDNDV